MLLTYTYKRIWNLVLFFGAKYKETNRTQYGAHQIIYITFGEMAVCIFLHFELFKNEKTVFSTVKLLYSIFIISWMQSIVRIFYKECRKYDEKIRKTDLHTKFAIFERNLSALPWRDKRWPFIIIGHSTYSCIAKCDIAFTYLTYVYNVHTVHKIWIYCWDDKSHVFTCQYMIKQNERKQIFWEIFYS